MHFLHPATEQWNAGKKAITETKNYNLQKLYVAVEETIE